MKIIISEGILGDFVRDYLRHSATSQLISEQQHSYLCHIALM